jgi:predicted phage terminase large subunit-like protein
VGAWLAEAAPSSGHSRRISNGALVWHYRERWQSLFWFFGPTARLNAPDARLDVVASSRFQSSLIEAARVSAVPELTRVVVAIDPAISSGDDADETGIIVAGKDRHGDAFVLADCSGRYAPIEWAKIAINAYRTHGADRIIGEVNQGGDMVETTLRMVDSNIPFTAVRASRGKLTRAEPISALYEQGRVHHLGVFPELEDQMRAFTPDIDRAAGSPDRVDALVWAISELMVAPMHSFGIYELYRQMAEEQTTRETVRIEAPDRCNSGRKPSGWNGSATPPW